MHQAKVLDRSERIAADEIAIRAHCGAKLQPLVASANDLRQLLRVKVEDGNDLLMAENTVDELVTFNRRLYAYAEAKGEQPFDVYQQLALF